jgi:hypothetical protein
VLYSPDQKREMAREVLAAIERTRRRQVLVSCMMASPLARELAFVCLEEKADAHPSAVNTFVAAVDDVSIFLPVEIRQALAAPCDGTGIMALAGRLGDSLDGASRTALADPGVGDEFLLLVLSPCHWLVTKAAVIAVDLSILPVGLVGQGPVEEEPILD